MAKFVDERYSVAVDRLVRASLVLRRIARRGYGLILIALLGVWIAEGGPRPPASFFDVVLAGAGLVVLVSRVRRRLWLPGEAPAQLDFEVGALLAEALFAVLLCYERSLTGRFSPALYVLVALVAAFARPLSGLLVVALVVGLEAAAEHVSFTSRNFDAFATHAGFLVAFALLNFAFLRAEVARIRQTARAEVDEERRALQEDARSYRLTGGADETTESDASREARVVRASLEEIHLSVHYALDLLRRALKLHSAVLLWLNDAGTHLKISELSSEARDINDAPIPEGDGVVGAVLARRERVALSNLRPSYNVPYYLGACPVRALLAIPVLDDQTLRGVLVVDRVENVPFSPHEEDMAEQAVRFCLRAIQNERIFVQLERAKVEQGKLYRAAKALAAALTEADVLEQAVRAAREIASFDHAAITLYDEASRVHEVRAAKGDGGELEKLVGLRFGDNSGLVSMVTQNRFPLPYRGEFDGSTQVVLTRRAAWPKVPSLLVLPLVLHDRPLGTLILGARRRHAFGDAVRPTLEVLASHLAVSLSNARVLHKLETMATTDGLTGLLNKRAMLEAAGQKVAAAVRFKRPLSVLVLDIDFFKKVNDTYGHDAGDIVIRGLAEVLKRQKRATDVVARFGGEEFVVLCEQTDQEGALLLAERIREEVQRTSFTTSHGALKVTCSVGIATSPDAGTEWDTLFKAADEALYTSKGGGRNRSTVYRSAPAPARRSAPRTKTA